MDTRIDPLAVLGLAVGEAHVIRNAGGVITDDVIRSLCVSQQLLGTQEIVLMHHNGCGMCGLDAESFTLDLQERRGARPTWDIGASTAPAHAVRQRLKLLQASPFIDHDTSIAGFVYDPDTGLLHEVTEATT